MGDLLDFQKRPIIGARLAEASLTLTAQLFGVLWTSLYDYDRVRTMARLHQWRRIVGENKKVNNRDLTLSKTVQITQKYCYKVTSNLNIHWFPQKPTHRELHKASIHERAAAAKAPVLKCEKDGVMIIKPEQLEHQDEL